MARAGVNYQDISKAAEYDLLQIQIKTICRYWFNTVLL